MNQKLTITIREIFTVTFATFIVYLGLEFWLEGLISNYFDLNILLLIVIVSGLTSLFYRNSESVI